MKHYKDMFSFLTSLITNITEHVEHGLITPRQPKYSRHSLVEKELTWCVSALTYNMQGI